MNYANLYALFYEYYSDNSALVYGEIKIGDTINVREKEYGQGHHLGKVVQFLGGGWLKVRWDWEGWRMSNVHKDWIVSDATSRQRTHVVTYNDDMIWINFSSLLN